MMTAPEKSSHNVSSEPGQVADQVAEALLGHPAVLRLDGGKFGVIATHLPGRRVTGVRFGKAGEPVEVALVLRLDRPLPDILTELRQRVTGVVGTLPVDITISDVDIAGET